MKKKSYIVAITGASGSIYGFRLLEELINHNYYVYLIISKPAFKVIKDELNMFSCINLNNNENGATNTNYIYNNIYSEIKSKFNIDDKDNYEYLDEMFIEAKISSGSASGIRGMAVIPCSMGSLSRIANGSSGNLIERASDVMLKERKKLIVSPRETPLNDIHLKNMLSLSRSGAIILPPIPAFYNKPKSIDDMVNFIIGKIMDSFGIENNIYKRWETNN
ncbi:MAG: UbiX family flavin prenyltransferase [Candidatus Acididesulfobacter diazotrophicus]|jgi:4-hydroxy-3-polyprenylbenzoate decarboxylase|uniref:Flavin prenyltransferase UbiX n=1 Tax=Candidatus Acididesulfobacter diazotrophicus TaxID=2597226 RepID=A0A519BPR6_9DELT|nr:MAG: UbiX family flavin prenyltransferase [Candidatus Acididesulfobacter diazotrophicus]